MNNCDLFFIRHAESQLNGAYLRFLEQNHVPHNWKVLSQRPDFLEKVKYNHDYIDCSITQNGIKKCIQARNQTNKLMPDVILVSPLLRTLQTCDIMFGDRDIPIFVEPLLSQALRSSCDISKDINEKIKKYPKYQFATELLDDDLWFIKNQNKNQQQEYNKVISDIDPNDHNLKCDAILAHMKQTLIYQSPTFLRERASRIKELLKKYKTKYNKIAIVAHFCTINYVVSHHFDENDEPIQCMIKNCEIYPTSLEDILSYS